MSKEISYKEFTGNFIVVSALLLVFLYDYLNVYLGFFDEFIALIFSLVIISALLFQSKIKLYQQEIYIAILLLFIAILGLLSNYFTFRSDHYTEIGAIIGDFISFFKAYIVYFGIRLLANNINSKIILDKIVKYSKIIFYFLLIILILDVFFQIFPKYPRFGIWSFQLFFTHTSRYAFAFSFIFLMLFPKYFKKNNLFLLFILFLGTLSLRVKYFGFFIFSVIFIYYGKIISRIPRKIFLWFIGVVMIGVALIFKNQLIMYFDANSAHSGWSRAIMMNYSYKIGNDFFPLGTGFGTYASHFSGKYYSWVYQVYGIDHVYGISKQYWEFISDQFWPMILGQFGYFGLIAFIGVIYNYFILFLKQMKNYYDQSNYKYIPLLGLLLLLIDSSSDAIFTQNRAVALFMVFGLFTNLQRNFNVTDS